MKKKKIEVSSEPIKKSNKYRIIGWLLIFTVSGLSAWWSANNRMKVQTRIKQYETIMGKRIYSACGCVDEEGTYATTTDWKKTDPELKGFKIDENTGRVLPIKDSSGKIIKEPPVDFLNQPKDVHIPFIRGFRWSDGYGQSNCIPCAKSKNQYEINICNSRTLYTNVTISDGDTTEKIDIENANEVDATLIVEIPDQESDEEILRQQAQSWGDQMAAGGAFEKHKINPNKPASY